MAQKRIRMVQRDILNDRLRLLYDDGTQGVLEYGEAVSRSKAPAIIKPNDFVGLTLKWKIFSGNSGAGLDLMSLLIMASKVRSGAFVMGRRIRLIKPGSLIQ